MRTIGAAERRARLGVRHLLAAPAPTPEAVAEAMVALHATDPATVYLSVHARSPACTVATVEDALYEQRSLIRLLSMRRTMFVVPVALAPAVQASCVAPAGSRQRKTYAQLIAEAGHGDHAWVAALEDRTAAALARRGEATAAQLSADVPELRSKVEIAPGKTYGSSTTITAWIMVLLAADGRIARGRPLGSWSSRQWRWLPMEKWLPGGMPDMPADEARAELARAWLARFGPATSADLRWWTGWTATHVKQALATVAAVEVDLDGTSGGGTSGYVLPGDEEAVPTPQPWVALLPALDPTPMGWAQRDWYLGAHAPQLFDATGNVAPTVWCDGRIVGGWARRPDGEIVFRLFEDIGREATAMVGQRAAELGEWVGDISLAPRARRRGALEQELLEG